eukprot:768917-Prorocentrum_lima.AAC.1
MLAIALVGTNNASGGVHIAPLITPVPTIPTKWAVPALNGRERGGMCFKKMARSLDQDMGPCGETTTG